MEIVVFKYTDGDTFGHACANATVAESVVDDVMHHAGNHVVAWRKYIVGEGWTGGSRDAEKHIQELPEHARLELE